MPTTTQTKPDVKPDFVIPTPRPGGGQVPAQQTPAQPSLNQVAPRVEEGVPSPFARLERAPSTTEMAIGVGAFVVLAAVFLFVRIGVKNHLRDRRAPIDAANAASWTLFAALTLTALVTIAATVGNLWSRWLVTSTGFAVCAVIFILFVVQFVRAPSQRR